MVRRNILQFAGGFTEEVVMIGRVGVEIRPAWLDHGLTQKPYLGKLMQSVVNRCERYRDSRGLRFAVQMLRRYVTVTTFEEEPRQRQALTGRPQPGCAQTPESG
jgi:hypothetical protein